LLPVTTQVYENKWLSLPELIEHLEQERRYALFGKYIWVILAFDMPQST
jgi:hypothetical protein